MGVPKLKRQYYPQSRLSPNQQAGRERTSLEQLLIKIIIEQEYQSNKQLLSLNAKSQWSDVLLSRDWSMLKQLNLGHCGITDDSIKTLCNLKWPHLTRLYLWTNKFTGRGIQQLIHCGLTNLKSLQLSCCQIGNSGVKYLVKIDLPNLQELGICECRIGSEGAKHLTKGRWPYIFQLRLSQYSAISKNKIQLSGWETIGLNHFPKLKQLYAFEVQPIYWINCTLIEKVDFKVNDYGICIQNQKMKYLIKKILKSRNLIQGE